MKTGPRARQERSARSTPRTSTTRSSFLQRARDGGEPAAEGARHPSLHARHAHGLQAHQARPARAGRDPHGRLGSGARQARRRTRRTCYKYPVEYTGFKLFYKNDTKKGGKLMTPAAVLALNPEAGLHPVSVDRARTTTIVASCRTGKLTELAMKHPRGWIRVAALRFLDVAARARSSRAACSSDLGEPESRRLSSPSCRCASSSYATT